MKTTLPTDCGNAPRIGVVADVVTNWAQGDAEALAEWLTDDATWTLVGTTEHNGEDAALHVCPSDAATHLEVTSIITHGRLASCDGFLDTEKGRIGFSHAFRFASTSKTAKIKDVRSYCIDVPR